VPAHNILDAYCRRWALADIPGNELRRLTLERAEWADADVHGTTFTACNFRGGDLQGADLSGVTLWERDFTGAELAGADLTGATFDRFTRWPAGLDPTAAGARHQE